MLDVSVIWSEASSKKDLVVPCCGKTSCLQNKGEPSELHQEGLAHKERTVMSRQGQLHNLWDPGQNEKKKKKYEGKKKELKLFSFFRSLSLSTCHAVLA